MAGITRGLGANVRIGVVPFPSAPSVTPFSFTNTLEGGTNAVAISNANSGGLSGDAFTGVAGTITPTFTTGAPIRGSVSGLADASGAGATSYAYWDWPGTGGADSYYRVYIQVPNPIPAGTLYVAASKGASNANACHVRLNSTGNFELCNSADTVVATSISVAPIGRIVRIEMHHFANAANSAAGTVEARLYIGSSFNSLTASEILGPVTTDASTAIGQQRYGLDNRTVAATLKWDGASVNNTTWVGPDAVAVLFAGWGVPIF
jgi:hypothetical protein